MGAALDLSVSTVGDLPWWVTGVILFREIGITLMRLWVIGMRIIPASRGGKLKTLAQGTAVGMYVLALTGPLATLRFWVMAVAVVLTVVTGLDYVAIRLCLDQRICWSGPSARTSTTGSTWCPSGCRPSANGRRMSIHLLHHFLRRLQGAGRPRHFSPEAEAALARYSWPGNVRELKNLVERLVVTTDGEMIRVEQLPDFLAVPGLPSTARIPSNNEELKAMKRDERERLCQELERAFLTDALQRNDWNVTRAARQTGMLRPNFHALMRKHHIRAAEH